MKLWLISQDVNNNYDTYDSAVVAAETEEEARVTFPNRWGSSPTYWTGSKWVYSLPDGRVYEESGRSWATPDNVSVQFLADGYDGPAGTVLASFNAG